jgi:hypothetical protein
MCTLYLVGGYKGNRMKSYKKTVLSALIPQLLKTGLQSSPAQWQSLSITNIPNYRSSAASLGGCLLAVGGVKDLIRWPLSCLLSSCLLSLHLFLGSCWRDSSASI